MGAVFVLDAFLILRGWEGQAFALWVDSWLPPIPYPWVRNTHTQTHRNWEPRNREGAGRRNMCVLRARISVDLTGGPLPC